MNNDNTQIIQKVFSIIKNNLTDQNKINKCIKVMKIINDSRLKTDFAQSKNAAINTYIA